LEPRKASQPYFLSLKQKYEFGFPVINIFNKYLLIELFVKGPFWVTNSHLFLALFSYSQIYFALGTTDCFRNLRALRCCINDVVPEKQPDPLAQENN